MPFGMNFPATVVLRTASRIVVGTVGYRRRTSWQTPFRRGRDSRSVWVIGLLPDGIFVRISSRRRVW